MSLTHMQLFGIAAAAVKSTPAKQPEPTNRPPWLARMKSWIGLGKVSPAPAPEGPDNSNQESGK